MHLDLTIALAGLVVGLVVGLTGMGGGALMTPALVLLFGIQPLAAVSSDLMASFVMKPVGGVVHWRRGTVNRPLVTWLAIGSVPSAFTGVVLLRAVGTGSTDGTGSTVQTTVRTSLGIALVVAASMLVVKAVLDVRRRIRTNGGAIDEPAPVVRPLPTLLVGVLGGLVVGLTSVGSGSLIIVLLLMLYPTLKASDLVGTDLVQAVPLVGSAALAHLLFGDFRLGLTASILVGSLPGVYVGARLSSTAPSWLVRPAIGIVLLASGLKSLDVPTVTVGYVLLGIVVAGPLAWVLLRQQVERRSRPAAPAPDLVTAAPGPAR